MSNKGFLGVDIGGTASRWVLLNEEGIILERGQAAGTSGVMLASGNDEAFLAPLKQIQAKLNLPIASVCIGSTGITPPVSVKANNIVSSLFNLNTSLVSINNDMYVAYLSLFGFGEGHLVSAGTGSIGLHLRSQNEVIRVGGRGMLIDDAGAGTWIALSALKQVCRLMDTDPDFLSHSILSKCILDKIGTTDWDGVSRFVYGQDRGQIGILATAVAEAANSNDNLAIEILEKAAEELCRLATCLIQRTELHPIAFIGGVLSLHPLIKESINTNMKKNHPGCEIDFPKPDLPLCAAKLAIKLYNT
ncbi:N-acetylglucosamine kinase [Thorsellia anophelis]|uniref:BadF-type ATPase n=1 Tax=Thorsellia anophelis DSM 18579 TaxID=1123402 RepID=A0A1I0DEY9_9GAMM|nr:BadF/BadG/BcrA/BcrD ATPase family protein [Thorsellia anophelis]SET30302.1 BadF-type ATPase [Thorsellia anophelis DSM 18579]